MAIPGNIVLVGSAVSPGGEPGPAGTGGDGGGTSIIGSSPAPPGDIPPSPPAVYNPGDIWLDETNPGQGYIWNGTTWIGPFDVAGSAVPPADTTQDGLLRMVSGNTTDYVDGTNACRPLPVTTDAPSDTKQYGRQDAAWTEILAGGAQVIESADEATAIADSLANLANVYYWKTI